MRRRVVRSGNGPLVVEITDTGVGMPAEDLAEANRSPARRTEVGGTASRRWGCSWSRGSRHGIDVRLVTGAGLAQARVQSGGEVVSVSSITGDPGITARRHPGHLVVGSTPRRQPVPQAAPVPAQQGRPTTPHRAARSRSTSTPTDRRSAPPARSSCRGARRPAGPLRRRDPEAIRDRLTGYHRGPRRAGRRRRRCRVLTDRA
ncbi:hypothetical protein [Pseudonocardia abyssalis]|uniref:Histidine kinase/HSP90-like ATPase domain-containing protein n=1 Tax=Pseudonocardia abyssalis TaxID=2792008 RepID=A0ABS6V249_9PSEU|nr:hypothetical protein [Pseudonocardia abyssalis]MBW0119490.1 hypothetical protein [Pseudonocardia abyssalis]MBW0138522.1 hypothetical protein [Pseudonocardia abyssalis]